LTYTPARFLAAFILGVVVGTAVFFHADRNHIKRPSAWASFVFFAPLVGLVAYLIYLRRLRRRRL
jgi:phage shock protein PspC (stress-responsive transcriptional regulator)